MIRNNSSLQKQDCFFAFDNILGKSDWAKRTRRRVMQLGRHRFNTFISGPEGSGKQLVARALHEHGPRRDAPFIPVDCSRLPSFLFRTQMLGCAYRETTTLGCLRSADGGTIYLSNVDALDLDSQQLLLEVIESSTVKAHGSDITEKVDVRVIASSTTCLEEAVRNGKFLPQLYSRLCVLPFETTALTDRKEDIQLIAKHLLARITFEQGLTATRFSDDALEALVSYNWPGNVGELWETIEEAAQNVAGEFIGSYDLGIENANSWPTLEEMQRDHIRSTIDRVNGDVERAAELLGIAEGELRRQME